MRNSNNYSTELSQVSLLNARHILVDKLINGMFITVLIGAPVSVLRAFSTGWLNIYSTHLVIATIVVLVFLFRNKVPFFLLKLFILFTFVFIGLIGAFTFGILGAGIWWLFMSTTLVGVLYSLRAGYVSILVCFILVLFASYCFTNDILKLTVDVNDYVNSYSSWALILVAAAMMSLVIFQTITSFHYSTLGLLNEIRLQKTQIKILTTHDRLTGLYLSNEAVERLHFVLHSAHEFNEKVAVLFIDIEGLVEVNNIFGYEAGDHVLQTVVKRLNSILKEDDIAVRAGGDEFLLIINNINNEINSVEIIAKSILEVISEPIEYDTNTLLVNSWIGIGLYPNHATTASSLIYVSKQAMHSVKKLRNDRYGYFNKLSK